MNLVKYRRKCIYDVYLLICSNWYLLRKSALSFFRLSLWIQKCFDDNGNNISLQLICKLKLDALFLTYHQTNAFVKNSSYDNFREIFFIIHKSHLCFIRSDEYNTWVSNIDQILSFFYFYVRTLRNLNVLKFSVILIIVDDVLRAREDFVIHCKRTYFLK